MAAATGCDGRPTASPPSAATCARPATSSSTSASCSPLIGLAWGSLFSFKGTAIVVEGQAFSNTLTQYDEFGAGAGFTPSQLSPFTVKLDDFEVKFETGPVQQGAARDFTAHVTVTGS